MSHNEKDVIFLLNSFPFHTRREKSSIFTQKTPIYREYIKCGIFGNSILCLKRYQWGEYQKSFLLNLKDYKANKIFPYIWWNIFTSMYALLYAVTFGNDFAFFSVTISKIQRSTSDRWCVRIGGKSTRIYSRILVNVTKMKCK